MDALLTLNQSSFTVVTVRTAVGMHDLISRYVACIVSI